MDLIQSQVSHRVGRKWKPRWAVLRRVAQNSDVLMLLFYKDASHAKEKPKVKHAVCLTDFCKTFKVSKVEKVQNILAIVLVNQTEFIACENVELQSEWEKILDSNYGKEAEFNVTIPTKQKIKPGDACLGIYQSFFSLSSVSTSKAIGLWAARDIYRYAVMEGRFYFEVKKNGKSKTYLYSIISEDTDNIVQKFDALTDKNNDEDTEMVSVAFHGSGILDELDKARRRETTDHNFFQRTVLRMSNRLRKNRHTRAETFSAADRPNRRWHSARSKSSGKRDEANTSGSSNDIVKGKERRPKQGFSFDETEDKPSKHGAQRSSSFAHFGTDRGHSKHKFMSGSHDGGKYRGDSGSLMKQSVGSMTKSDDTRGPSVSSDVFEDDESTGKDKGNTHGRSRLQSSEQIRNDSQPSETTKSKSESILCKPSSNVPGACATTGGNNKGTSLDGPPVAPPRSPISLGMFSFPSPDQSIASNESELRRTYVNTDDLVFTKEHEAPAESDSVKLRRRSSVSLLEEIDKEFKRRTNTSLMEGSSSVASVGSSRGSVEVENDTSRHGKAVDAEDGIGAAKRGSGSHLEDEKVSKHLNECTAKSRNESHGGRIADEEENSPPVAVNGEVPTPSAIADRLTRRESATKHLSDPVLMERVLGARDSSGGSLSDLEQRPQYVNVQNEDDESNIAGSYVNVSADGSLNPTPSSQKSKPKPKPKPLALRSVKTPWEKYDDEDPTIYHRVGPLVGSNASRSTEQINAYQNVTSYGSYENIAGRGVVRDRAYVNVPSPSSKKPSQSLTYVFFGGTKSDYVDNIVSPRRHSPLATTSDDSYKIDYTMIDEKATSLINKTREEHRQRREDGHTKLSKKGR